MPNCHIQKRDRKFAYADISAHLTEKQRRFLEAYECYPWEWAKAAKLAGVHGCSAYRWSNDPAFNKARKAIEAAERVRQGDALKAFMAEWKAELKAEAERWRREHDAYDEAVFSIWEMRRRKRRRLVAPPKSFRAPDIALIEHICRQAAMKS